jgi:surfeit locus 1 family protein
VLRRFRPGWIPTLATALALALLCSLGTWQVHRAAWRKADLAAKNATIDLPPLSVAEALRDPASAAWRRATVRGRYDYQRSIAVEHVPRGLREGANLLTPLRLAEPEGRVVVVDRGWVPDAEVDAALHPPADAGGEVEVTGLVFPLALGDAAPGGAAEPRVRWTRFDPARPGHPQELQAQLPYRIEPLLIQREADGREGYPAGGISRPTSPVNHIAYAFTWYGIAAAAFATWVGLGVKNGREAEKG